MPLARDSKMTVADLLAALEALPDKDLPIWADGCGGCANPVDGVTVEEGTVWLGVVL